MTFPTSDPDDELVSRHVLDDDTDNDDGQPPPRGRYHLWWATHAPETYALTALIFALAAFVLVESIVEFLQAYSFNRHSGSTTLDIGNGMRAALALASLLFAARAIVLEDEDTSWSAPVARTALIVGGLAFALAIAAIIAAHTGGSSSGNPFIQ